MMPPLVTEEEESSAFTPSTTDQNETDHGEGKENIMAGVINGQASRESSYLTPNRRSLRTSKTTSPTNVSPTKTETKHAEIIQEVEEAEPDTNDSEEESESSSEDPLSTKDETAEQTDTQMEDEDDEAEAEAEADADEEEEVEVEEQDEGGAVGSTSPEEVDNEAESETSACIFCAKMEDEAEDELTTTNLRCTNCKRFAHEQCARSPEDTKEANDNSQWLCPDCVKIKVNSESPKDTSIRSQSRNSAPRLVRDLLPVSRGVQRPDAHSIFAQPLISESEDGGRSLRKRKSPGTDAAPLQKRRRKSSLAHGDEVIAAVLGDSRAVAHSTRRATQRPVPTARILQHRPFDKPPPHKFILAFRLDQERIEQILAKPPKPGRRKQRNKLSKIPPPPIFQAPVQKFPALPPSNLIFPSVLSDREHELYSKPYGGVLGDGDADTSRSLPQARDREIFELARKEAEEERRRTSEAADELISGEYQNQPKPNQKVSGPPSKIKCIQFGKHVIDTFYAAPYPEEYSHEARLFICEFCLKYLPSEFVAWRHKLKCPAKHPPGDEIYRDGSISIWEVDGRKKTEYCQCLCLLAKMFLGSKTLYYDVEPFLFYILTEYDELGYHFVGYFSKEKRPASMNNVSCILVMPIHQRKGYAMFLIDFSYLLTRIEGKEGSPEKPLSDMGLTAYRAYWDLTLSRHLLHSGLKPFSVKTLMDQTGMTADDVVHSLERLYAFIRDPVTKTYGIRYDRKLYERIVTDFDNKKHRTLRPEMLVWTPYVMGRSDQATLDGQPLQTIAPREGDEADEVAVDSQDTITIDAGRIALEPPSDSLSPQKRESRSRSRSAVEASRAPTMEPELPPTSTNGIVAPGRPSTSTLIENAISTTQIAITPADDTPATILVNGQHASDDKTQPALDDPEQPPDSEPTLTGYALAYHTHNIPPTRFQIDPPIPPSMLRQKSVKKRASTAVRAPTAMSGVVNGLRSGNATPTTAGPSSGFGGVAKRSSPRHAASLVDASVASDMALAMSIGSGTPVRRSVRRVGTGLTNEISASNGGLDGSVDDDEEDEGEEEEEEEEEVVGKIETSESEESGEESTSAEAAVEEDEEDEEDEDAEGSEGSEAEDEASEIVVNAGDEEASSGGDDAEGEEEEGDDDEEEEDEVEEEYDEEDGSEVQAAEVDEGESSEDD